MRSAGENRREGQSVWEVAQMCDSGVSPLLWWEERSAEQAQTPAHGSVHSISGSLWAQPDSAPAQSESEPDESSELEALLLLSDLFSLSSTSSSSMSSSFWKWIWKDHLHSKSDKVYRLSLKKILYGESEQYFLEPDCSQWQNQYCKSKPGPISVYMTSMQ